MVVYLAPRGEITQEFIDSHPDGLYKENNVMSTKKKTKISSVHFKYVGTDEQYNAFIKSVVKDYITDDRLLPDTEEEIIVVQKSAYPIHSG